jgi:hypothetical protein
MRELGRNALRLRWLAEIGGPQVTLEPSPDGWTARRAGAAEGDPQTVHAATEEEAAEAYIDLLQGRGVLVDNPPPWYPSTQD